MRDEPGCAGLLRRLAVSDDGTIGSIFAGEITDLENSELGDKTRALVRLAALIATESGGAFLPVGRQCCPCGRSARRRGDRRPHERRSHRWHRASRLSCARARVSAWIRARCPGSELADTTRDRHEHPVTSLPRQPPALSVVGELTPGVVHGERRSRQRAPSGEGPPQDLFESKLHPPVAHAALVSRAALVDRLDASDVPITVVAAPPGYGKTTLLAEWSRRHPSRVRVALDRPARQ